MAIAYGYNNVRWTVPPTVTVGKEVPLNQLCELLRSECAMAGYGCDVELKARTQPQIRHRADPGRPVDMRGAR